MLQLTLSARCKRFEIEQRVHLGYLMEYVRASPFPFPNPPACCVPAGCDVATPGRCRRAGACAVVQPYWGMLLRGDSFAAGQARRKLLPASGPCARSPCVPGPPSIAGSPRLLHLLGPGPSALSPRIRHVRAVSQPPFRFRVERRYLGGWGH